MNHTAFFEQVKKGNIQPVYLMEGTEEYIKQQAVRQLCIDANCHLGEDVKECIRCSRRLSSKEISPSAR